MLAPCPARTPEALRPRWMGHFCGLCLELRDDAGHAARLTTNFDALALSVLVEAQGEAGADSRTAGPCALRGMRRQRIPTGDGPRLAATASLLLASAKLSDHIVDGDGLVARPGVAGLAARTADRYRAKATAIGGSIGLPVDRIVAAIERQQTIENQVVRGTPLEAVTAPTAEATGELFAHAAVLAGQPGNADPFRAAGEAFGALAHLLDAAEDYEADAQRGAWNPLHATGTSRDQARRAARRLLTDMKTALEAASLVDATMVRLLLDRYAGHAVAKTFGSVCASTSHQRPGAEPGRPYGPQNPPPGQEHSGYQPPKNGWTPGRGFWGGLCGFMVLCCTCQICCARHYVDSWSGQIREGCLRDGDCNCDCPCDDYCSQGCDQCCKDCDACCKGCGGGCDACRKGCDGGCDACCTGCGSGCETCNCNCG
ncbi:DUF5685 family protein [Glycomyces sp. L485]|uniref:DUF5685 family protein n=1 Tax=Glycomyces sp. L485 TaxID=2909235 RepID=UPI001F4A737E|nr:DUF5685 family protein [Glycomyces sp. L485]MCH7229791.1 DUF5685 family protein [Glycomyces sp. L485]